MENIKGNNELLNEEQDWENQDFAANEATQQNYDEQFWQMETEALEELGKREKNTHSDLNAEVAVHEWG